MQGASVWLYRVLAAQRTGWAGVSPLIQFTWEASREEAYSYASSPSRMVLSAPFLDRTYTCFPADTPSPFRWPAV